jgi:hypothetical protein
MSRRRSTAALAACALAASAAAVEAQPAASPSDIWFAVAADPAQRAAVVAAVTADLARTPLGHGVHFVAPDEVPSTAWPRPPLAVVEVAFDGRGAAPEIVLAHGQGAVSPGWLVHAAARGLAAAGDPARLEARRPRWLGQLVARGMRRLPAGAADEALAAGVAAVGLRLREADAAATRDLAAVARRLDGLDGRPRFDDQYLMLGGRVWPRRDLYWLGLGLWLPLYWRGRRRAGRPFRWLFLVAWLVAPAVATLLLSLPALAAVAAPRARGLRRAWALAPVALYGGLLATDLATGARPVVALVPGALVLAALVTFLGLLDPPAAAPAGDAAARPEPV